MLKRKHNERYLDCFNEQPITYYENKKNRNRYVFPNICVPTRELKLGAPMVHNASSVFFYLCTRIIEM